MLFIIFRYITVISTAFLLSSCLGGSIAQQIVSTIATRVADRAIANAMDVQDGPSKRKADSTYNSYANNSTAYSTNTNSFNTNSLATNNKNSNNNGLAKNNTLNNSPAIPLNTARSDPYQAAFLNTAFEPVKAESEPFSDSNALPQQAEEIETRVAITEGNQLVRVELFNLLIGDEKNAVFEKARLLGSTSLPQKREWPQWRVGTGALTIDGQNDKKIITFLIPPEFGKLPSGSVAVVELASPGELNVARYKAN